MRIFAISPREHDPAIAWSRIDTTVRLADEHGFTGILAHTGNDTLVDPWLVGQHAMVVSERLRPLVAINPMYHHPFAVAQLVSSLTYRHGRGLFLNLVAGTANNDRVALGDHTEHDRRYDRLLEFSQAVLGLLGNPAPVTQDGEFYQLRGARLRWPGPPELRPVPFIAGQSPAAIQCADALGAVRITMFGMQPPEPTVPGRLGLYAGLVIRATDEEAWKVALERYPLDADAEAAGAAALRYTDAVWRHKAFEAANDGHPDWYWTAPMRSLRADCPLLVGGIDTLAPVFAACVAAGVEDYIVDLAADEDDFLWAARTLAHATATPTARGI
jgi:alkanesulfonate monooxygenase